METIRSATAPSGCPARIGQRGMNPWGVDEPAPPTWTDLAAYGGWIVVADAAGMAPLADASSTASAVSGPEVRAAALANLAGNGNFRTTDATANQAGPSAGRA